VHRDLLPLRRLLAVADDDVLDPELERDVALGLVDLRTLGRHVYRTPRAWKKSQIATIAGTAKMIPSNDAVENIFDRQQFADVWLPTSRSGGIAYVIHPAGVPLPPHTPGLPANW